MSRGLVAVGSSSRPSGIDAAGAYSAELPRVYINGGKHGYIISLDTVDLLRVLQPVLVQVSQAQK
ncbi:hypothetical protein [Thioalkalivibrio sp.]|uniref:hypothetical protein n=1 Tax=Thioalkalivibrio sp. TaxID=2093813 RepID=UPI003569BB28